MLSRFHLIPERYGQTDRQTDRQICYINIARQDSSQPPFWPKMGRSHPKFPERWHPWHVHVYGIWSGLAALCRTYSGKIDFLAPRLITAYNNLNTQLLYVVKSRLGYKNFSAVWRAGGGEPPNVNLGPLISRKLLELSKKLNLKISLDMVKYPFWVQKLLHYMIQHEATLEP